MIDFIQEFLSSILEGILGVMCSILPDSPFTSYIDNIDKIPYLKTINYFIPIKTFLAIGEAWLTCIVAWYIFQLVYKVICEVSDMVVPK